MKGRGRSRGRGSWDLKKGDLGVRGRGRSRGGGSWDLKKGDSLSEPSSAIMSEMAVVMSFQSW